MKKKPKWMKSFIGMIVVETIFFCGLFFAEKNLGFNSSFMKIESSDAYFTILSLAFIVSTISSLLAERNMPIYWSDVQYEMLIRPRFTNLIALIAYICATVVVSSVIVWIRPEYIIFCLIVITFLLILVTHKSLMAHFSREKIKKALRSEYLKSQNDDLISLLMERTIKAIENSDISGFLENMELINSSSDNKDYLLQYASDVNPFLLYKYLRTQKSWDEGLIFGTLTRLIRSGESSAALYNLLEIFVEQKYSKYIDVYIQGIASIEISGTCTEYWQFEKAKNQLDIYVKNLNENNANHQDSLADLMIIALAEREYDALVRIISYTNKIREKEIESASEKINSIYGDSNTLKGVLPYFQKKLENIDFYGFNDTAINEFRKQLSILINDRKISNNYMSKIVSGIPFIKDDYLSALIISNNYYLKEN